MNNFHNPFFHPNYIKRNYTFPPINSNKNLFFNNPYIKDVQAPKICTNNNSYNNHNLKTTHDKYNNNSINNQNLNEKCTDNSFNSHNITDNKNESKHNCPIIEIAGLKLYNDDLLILALIYFLYKEHVEDKLLLIALFSLLF